MEKIPWAKVPFIYVWFVTLPDGGEEPLQSPLCFLSRTAFPGGSAAVAWLQAFGREPPLLPLQFSQCPLRVCGHTASLRCPWAGGDVEQSVNPPSAPWLFCARVLELPGARLARGCAVIAWLCLSCGAVCWQQLLALWGCCLALCSPGAEGRWGSSGCHQSSHSPPRGTPAIYSSR